MQIGQAQDFGNAGDRIVVKLPSGKTIEAIAANAINSSKVLVAGGYVWSETSPILVLSRTDEIYQSKIATVETVTETILYLSSIIFEGKLYLGYLNSTVIELEITPLLSSSLVYSYLLPDGNYNLWIIGAINYAHYQSSDKSYFVSNLNLAYSLLGESFVISSEQIENPVIEYPAGDGNISTTVGTNGFDVIFNSNYSYTATVQNNGFVGNQDRAKDYSLSISNNFIPALDRPEHDPNKGFAFFGQDIGGTFYTFFAGQDYHSYSNLPFVCSSGNEGSNNNAFIQQTENYSEHDRIYYLETIDYYLYWQSERIDGTFTKEEQTEEEIQGFSPVIRTEEQVICNEDEENYFFTAQNRTTTVTTVPQTVDRLQVSRQIKEIDYPITASYRQKIADNNLDSSSSNSFTELPSSFSEATNSIDRTITTESIEEQEQLTIQVLLAGEGIALYKDSETKTNTTITSNSNSIDAIVEFSSAPLGVTNTYNNQTMFYSDYYFIYSLQAETITAITKDGGREQLFFIDENNNKTELNYRRFFSSVGLPIFPSPSQLYLDFLQENLPIEVTDIRVLRGILKEFDHQAQRTIYEAHKIEIQATKNDRIFEETLTEAETSMFTLPEDSEITITRTFVKDREQLWWQTEGLLNEPIFAVTKFEVNGEIIYKRFAGQIIDYQVGTETDENYDRINLFDVKYRFDSVETIAYSAVVDYFSRDASFLVSPIYIYNQDNCNQVIETMATGITQQRFLKHSRWYKKNGEYYLLCSQVEPSTPRAYVDVFRLENDRLIHVGAKESKAYPIANNFAANFSEQPTSGLPINF